MGFDANRTTNIPLCARPDLDGKDELIELVHMIDFAHRHRYLHEQLYQLHEKGPVWDGDVVCKNHRDLLSTIGACAKVSMKGEQGFNACTYFGTHLLRIYDWLHGPFGKLTTDVRVDAGGVDMESTANRRLTQRPLSDND